MVENKVYTIQEITDTIDGNIQSIGEISVIGEITDNPRPYPGSGHYYLQITDGRNVFNFNVWASKVASIDLLAKGKLSKGMKIIITGTIHGYGPRSNYSLWCTKIEEAGVGDEKTKLDNLIKRLKAEGAFERPKKTLPKYIKKVAVVTAIGGAVIHDIESSLISKFPDTKILEYDCKVTDPESIAVQIKNADKSDADTIIFGRGGDSSFNLSVYNDERVIRAILDCRKPVISAVGHQEDHPLANDMADISVGTPSKAGQCITDNNEETLGIIFDFRTRINNDYWNYINDKKLILANITNSIEKNDPIHRIRIYEQNVKNFKVKISKDVWNIIENKKLGLENMKSIPVKYHALLEEKKRPFDYLKPQITPRYQELVKSKHQDLLGVTREISNLNPLEVLLRGYSATYSGKNIVRSIEQVTQGDPVTIRLSDGIVNAVVESTEKMGLERKQ